MRNDRLTQTLIIRRNSPILHKLFKNVDEILINTTVGMYQVNKWRWSLHKFTDNTEIAVQRFCLTHEVRTFAIQKTIKLHANFGFLVCG